METKKCDIIIIGAGVVGCAIARELSIKYPDKKITVLEKLKNAGLETSSFNSGVLHSGIHQNPNFLKSKLARQGNKMAIEYAKRNSLPILEHGMLIAISGKSIMEGLWKEWRSLWHLLKNGWEQKINFELLPSGAIKELEPNINAVGGIFLPDVCVIDPLQFTQCLKNEAEKNGTRFCFSNGVIGIINLSQSRIVFTANNQYEASVVINAAGLYADEIANGTSCNKYKIYPWRGEYYEVLEEKRNLVRRLVYPVMPSNSPSKGIHFSPRVDGRLFIGPNARLIGAKYFYDYDKTPVEVFLKSVQHFCPELQAKDLKWAYSGIRPKLTDQAEESDFVIRLDGKNPPLVNLIGIESPGLSASMAIAEYVVNLLKDLITPRSL
mgnify:CR=1 FL=1